MYYFQLSYIHGDLTRFHVIQQFVLQCWSLEMLVGWLPVVGKIIAWSIISLSYIVSGNTSLSTF